MQHDSALPCRFPASRDCGYESERIRRDDLSLYNLVVIGTHRRFESHCSCGGSKFNLDVYSANSGMGSEDC